MLELTDKGPPIPNKNNIKAMMMIMRSPPPKIKSKGWSDEVIIHLIFSFKISKS